MITEKKLDNCCYNKVKLLAEISQMIWFIERHAEPDAQKANDEKCFIAVEELRNDLEKYVVKLSQLVCKSTTIK